MRSIRNCWKAKSSVYRLKSKKCSLVAVDAVFDSVSVATTLKDKLSELGTYSALFQRMSIPNSSKNIWVQSFRPRTTFLQRSTCRIYRWLICAIPKRRVPWSYRPIFASTRPTQDSLNARSSWPMKAISATEDARPMRDENQLHAAVAKSLRSTMRKSILDRSELPQAKKRWEALATLSRSAEPVEGITQRYLGRRLRRFVDYLEISQLHLQGDHL